MSDGELGIWCITCAAASNLNCSFYVNMRNMRAAVLVKGHRLDS